jgi:hypothetical protein
MLRLLLLRRRPSPQEVRASQNYRGARSARSSRNSTPSPTIMGYGDWKIHGSANDYSASAARRPCHRDEKST